jgi:protoporphyrinogen oxidase
MHAGRRKFLKQSFLGLAGVGIAAPFLLKRKLTSSFMQHCPFEGSAEAVAATRDGPAVAMDPIMVVTSPQDQKDFAGDRPSRAHKALWDKDNYLKSKGGIPAPSEIVPIVVIGGGMSGLTAAFRLQDLKPIVLEQAEQFGGNAKAERWEGTDYTIGAAYINPPEAGTISDQLLTDLGIKPKFRVETGKDEMVEMKGQFKAPFWTGVTDPTQPHEFKRVYDKFMSMSPDGIPTIPPDPNDDAAKRAELNRLDSMTMAEWVKQELGAVHPHVEELLREYAWSSLLTDYEEVSAAQMLNFFISDLTAIQTLPGGNAGISQALFDHLKKKLPDCSLRPGCLVIDISQDATGVRVCYEGPDGNLKTIQAKSVVNTSAKFISKIVVSGLPDDQIDAIDSLDYRAFVVANVLLKNPIKSPGYDVFSMTGEVPKDPKKEIANRVYTDLTFANWSQGDQTAHGVVSLFRPYPYDGGRKELYKPTAFDKIKADFKTAVPTLLTSMGIDPASVVEIRLSRWGHALPCAKKGLIADGTVEKASRPIGKVFFGQQDNWASPCFESAIAAATFAADSARKAAGLT